MSLIQPCSSCVKNLPSPNYKTCQPCRDRTRRSVRQRRLDPLRLRSDHLRKAYGLTLDDYEAMRVAQQYRCAICGRHEDEIPQPSAKGRPRLDGRPKVLAPKLVVDHCHRTGLVRGLLCGPCNHGLGRFKDDVDLLRAAAKYLGARRHND